MNEVGKEVGSAAPRGEEGSVSSAPTGGAPDLRSYVNGNPAESKPCNNSSGHGFPWLHPANASCLYCGLHITETRAVPEENRLANYDEIVGQVGKTDPDPYGQNLMTFTEVGAPTIADFQQSGWCWEVRTEEGTTQRRLCLEKGDQRLYPDLQELANWLNGLAK